MKQRQWNLLLMDDLQLTNYFTLSLSQNKKKKGRKKENLHQQHSWQLQRFFLSPSPEFDLLFQSWLRPNASCIYCGLKFTLAPLGLQLLDTSTLVPPGEISFLLWSIPGGNSSTPWFSNTFLLSYWNEAAWPAESSLRSGNISDVKSWDFFSLYFRLLPVLVKIYEVLGIKIPYAANSWHWFRNPSVNGGRENHRNYHNASSVEILEGLFWRGRDGEIKIH